MKKLTFLLLIGVVNSAAFAQHSLESLWQSDTVLKAPESVRFDAGSKILYVSNIGEFDKDATGSISKLGMDGKLIKKDWVTGLTATKGLGIYNNTMYAAEQKTVAVIDISKGKITSRISIEGAEMLNDVTIDAKGIVYVSDTKKGIIHRIEGTKHTAFLENLKDVNGLLAVGTDLYFLADGKFQKADASKKLTVIADGIEGGADGIEKAGDQEFILTGWEGVVYYIKSDGSKETLLDTREKKINTADLGYDPATKILYIPAMMNNKVYAYQLK